MKGKKLLFLFLALLLPVAIFVFLKIFGRNEFDVPVLHQDSIPAISSNCNVQYTTPYRIADSVMASLRENGSDSLYVIFAQGRTRTEMERIATEFSEDPLMIAAVSDLVPAADIRFLKECIFLMEDDVSVVLVDHRNRIRGYYDADDRDEMDRLIVEIKIILKKY
jgi:hypothetical protein